MKMMKYLIALDLDGTLLNDQGKVPKKNKQVVQTLIKKGHMVVIATGRPYHATIDIYNELELRTPLITDNGGNIRMPHNADFKPFVDGIPVESAHALFRFAKPHLESAFFSHEDKIYNYRYLDRLHAIFKDNGRANHHHVSFDEINISPTGMIYLIETHFKSDFESFIEENLKDFLQYRCWGEDSKHAVYEIYKSNTSKLSAIDWVIEKYDLNSKNVIAIGDGINDIEMVKGVALGIAMKNGVDEVKRVAKTITKETNDEDGVGLFLENMLLK